MARHEADSPGTGLLTNRTYDFIRFLVELFLPGLGTLYFALSQIWGFPYGEAVVGSVVAVAVFLGSLVKVSRAKYTPAESVIGGKLVVDETDPEKDTFMFEVDTPLFDLKDGDILNFKVQKAE